MLVLFQRDLVQFQKNDRPTDVDTNEFTLFSEITAKLGIDGPIRKEATQQLKEWVNRGWVTVERVLHENPLGQHRHLNRINFGQFKERWEEDLKVYARKAVRLLNAGISAKDKLRATFQEEDGILGERLRRVLRLAGIVLEGDAYVQKYIGRPTPVRKIQAPGAAEKWLKDKLLAQGPGLAKVFRQDGKKEKGFTNDLVTAAATKLKCQRLDVFVDVEPNKPPRRFTFWGLPSMPASAPGESDIPAQEMPTIEAAKLAAEKHHKSDRKRTKAKTTASSAFQNQKAEAKATGDARAGATGPAGDQPGREPVSPTAVNGQDQAPIQGVPEGHEGPATKLKRAPRLMSAPDLAAHIERPVPAVESFLRRFRLANFDCFEEMESRRRNDPRFMYRTARVLGPLKEHFGIK